MLTPQLSSSPGCEPINRAFGMSLADVMEKIENDQTLDLIPKRKMLSAIRTVCRIFRANPKFVPAEPRVLSQRFRDISHTSTGLTLGSWNNVRSLTLTGIRHAGVRAMCGSTRAPLGFAWEALRARLGQKRHRYALSRLMSYCTTHEIDPDAVDQAVFDRYRDALENESLVKNPKQVYRTTCIVWNEASRTTSEWPQVQVIVPNGTRHYAYGWDKFPEAFRADAEDYLDHLTCEDVFSDDYVEALRPATIEGRRQQILQIASALVLSGHPADQITGLAALVTPANAKLALGFFWERAGKQKTERLYHQAVLIRNIARHWVKPSDDALKAIEDLSRRFATKKNGMTEKNRNLLRQFDDQRNVDALLTLPARVLQRVQGNDKGGRRDAGYVALALAVEMLIIAPMRLQNLTFLEHERHLVPSRLGPSAVVHLVIPGEEVKNSQPYELALPKETADFLALYLKDYQPRMTPSATPWLFPGYGGRRRHPEGFSHLISKFVLRETGIRMHVHLFRQLAAKLYLEAHPEDLETVRRIFGHTSLRTTLRSYAEIKTAAAFRRYDDMIASRRAQALTRLPSIGRQGGGL
jgi:integrase